MAKNTISRFLLGLSLVIGTLPIIALSAPKVPTAPRWQRFELTFKSSVAYANPLQEAEMRVLFVSPLGETNRVYGFWDGGKTWRVRFQPNFAGRWTYYTMCSDTANSGLHEQTGTFLCTAGTDESRFDRHGPIRVARSQQYLEHADRTPFLWLGDAAWAAAIKSTDAEWRDYVRTRAEQKFNVVQWRLDFETDNPAQRAFHGDESLMLNLDVLRQLDAKIATANRFGLLCAIAPLWEIGNTNPISEDQAIRLLRYALARWGADNVTWIVAFETDSSGTTAARWINIGRAVFNQVTHAPVILFPGESTWVFDGFRLERWVDAFGLQTTAAAQESMLPWLWLGPLSKERTQTPARPIITISPPAESETLDATYARRLLWWSLLLNSPAGVSYAHINMQEWNTTREGGVSPAWRTALTAPGAGFVAPVADCFQSLPFSQLTTRTIIRTPLTNSPPRTAPIVRATSADNKTTLFYFPDENIASLPEPDFTKTTAKWLNPRTGEIKAISAASNSTATNLRPPAAGDWVFLFQPTIATATRDNLKNRDAKIDKLQRH